jgi:formamidopyrimidine-DNA glycosylase
MPELPEVETTARGLIPILRGQKITTVQVRVKKLRWDLPINLGRDLTGATVTDISRRAKYMVLTLDRDLAWVIHLGMSGRMHRIDTAQWQTPLKHDHLLLHLANDTYVTFNDPRKFGMMGLVAADKIDTYRHFAHLGAEPLTREFDGEYLFAQLQRRKIAVKLAIMDQKLVVGVGNIYASEALYRARINPKRPAHKITPDECDALAKAVKDVLKAAIKAGGSSLRDYVQSDGAIGHFQDDFAVYGRTGQPCPACKRAKTPCEIQKLAQGGRSTFWCSNTQS